MCTQELMLQERQIHDQQPGRLRSVSNSAPGIDVDDEEAEASDVPGLNGRVASVVVREAGA